MPIYDMKCRACEKVQEVICKISDMEKQTCSNCSGEMKVIFLSDYQGASYGFKSGWYEHIAADPVYIGSKRQLRGETEKRGLTSQYARD